MKIDSHNPFPFHVGDNRHSPLKLVSPPISVGTMREQQHKKVEAQRMGRIKSQQKAANRKTGRVMKLPKITLPKVKR